METHDSLPSKRSYSIYINWSDAIILTGQMIAICYHHLLWCSFDQFTLQSSCSLLIYKTVVKLGIGGFCIGAAAALYSATCFVHGKFGTGNPYPATLSVVVGLSGWMPYLKSLSNKVEGEEAAQRATSLPILICHGRGDSVVRFKSGKKSWRKLISCGFQDCMFKTYTGLGHHILSEELEEVGAWLSLKLSLDGPQS